MASVCPNCGSSNTSFVREDAGFVKTANGSRRQHRTVGVCKNCGYTWVTDGPRFNSIKLPRSKWFYLVLFVLVIVVGYVFMNLVVGRFNSLRKLFRRADYKVTKENVIYVTNPSQSYIIESLEKVDGVLEIQAASEGHDPNRLFGKGASSVVFFSYNGVAQSGSGSIVDKGTDCGGCIEVFKDEASAKKRDRYLGIMGLSGSHVRIGTVVVRTSHKLSRKEQDLLESMICKALLKIEQSK